MFILSLNISFITTTRPVTGLDGDKAEQTRNVIQNVWLLLMELHMRYVASAFEYISLITMAY